MVESSVVIPAYNEEAEIGKCLTSLNNQSYKDFEIIVIDDGSTDSTLKIAKSFKNVKVIKGQHKGPGYSRNLGAKKAKGKILVFVDADMTFHKDYLKRLIFPILKGEHFGTEDGQQIASNQNNIWSKCWGTYFKIYPEVKYGKVFRAILKSKFFDMGGFDPSLGYADDLTFYRKYGVQSIRVQNSICYHNNPETLKEVYKQSRWIGASFESYFFRMPIVRFLVPFTLLIASPILIPLLAVRKCVKIKNMKVLFPWMIIFICFRYMGSIKGIFNKVYRDVNVR